METLHYLWTLFFDFFEFFVLTAIFGLFLLYIHDKYVQRKHALLINYPVIGRGRYLLEALREPMRQYFAEESFYDSKDKVDWVYKAAKDVPNYQSFSVTQPFGGSRFIIKHATNVLNEDEVDENGVQVNQGAGAAYVFENDGSDTWSQVSKLVAPVRRKKRSS